RSTGSTAVFFLVDQDEDPCLSVLRQEFAGGLPDLFATSRAQREAILCVATREIEAWFLADEQAIRAITGSDYCVPRETGECPTKRRLGELFTASQHALLGLNDIQVAKAIGGKFNPIVARRHSKSFDYFWSWVETKVPARH